MPYASARSGARTSVAWMIGVLVLVSVAPLGASLLDALTTMREPDFVTLQPQEDGFRRLDRSPSLWEPEYPGADASSSYVYADRYGREVYAFEAAYRTQSDGRELINIMNNINGIGWSAKSKSQVSLRVGPRTVAVAQRTLARSGGPFLCLWYWYDLGGHVEASDTAAKLVQIRRRLAGRSDAAIIAAAVPANQPDCSAQTDILTRFHRAVLARALQTD